MSSKLTASASVALVLLVGAISQAQEPVPSAPLSGQTAPPQPGSASVEGPGDSPPPTAAGLDVESQPYQQLLDIVAPALAPRLGPTPVDQVGLLKNGLGLAPWLDEHAIRLFGWAEAGYTGSSSGSGIMAVQPRQNRYGNEFLFDQLGLVLQKPLNQDRFDWGFHIRYFAGADAALGQPKGGIDDPPGDPRFSNDFRDLYLSAHLPILTEKGVNVKVGRMNTIIGWNGFLAPYRPLYSSDYQFFYSQDGAFTGFLTQVVVSDQLDIWNGMTLGANTFFEKRSADSYCYIGQVNYWLQPDKRTQLTASTYIGRDAIFAAPGLGGDMVTMFELRVTHGWSERLFQVVQSNFGWDQNTPVGTGSWFGLYTVGIYHVADDLDLIGRAEWFRDVKGTRTGVDTSYSEVTLGLNWHPVPFLEIRPEVRGDFAGKPAFGVDDGPRDRSQLTAAISALFKF
jgi:hypothetical protein